MVNIDRHKSQNTKVLWNLGFPKNVKEDPETKNLRTTGLDKKQDILSLS